jgi:hypothetical protein
MFWFYAIAIVDVYFEKYEAAHCWECFSDCRKDPAMVCHTRIAIALGMTLEASQQPRRRAVAQSLRAPAQRLTATPHTCRTESV